MSDETLSELKLKQPIPAGIRDHTLLNGPVRKFDSQYFDGFNGNMIERAAKFDIRCIPLFAREYKIPYRRAPRLAECVARAKVSCIQAAKMTNGAAGPSTTDAEFFRRILVHKNFKGSGQDLRDEVATFARKIASEYLDP